MDTLQIISLRIANYFVKHHDYRLLTINQMQGELFLLNPAHEKYPLIRIDVTGNPLSAQKIVALNQFMLSQQPLTRGNNFLLTLALNGEPEMYDNHEIVVIREDFISKESLSKDFKGLSKVSWAINNPVDDLRKVVASLNKETKTRSGGRGWIGVLKNSTAVLIFTIISLVFFAATVLLDGVTGNRIDSLIILGGFYKPFITAGGEVWRFITAGFLHSDILHLLANLLALNNIGFILEKIYGWKKMVITIMTAIIVGHFFVYIGETSVLTIGLSGGVYGLFGLLVVYAFESQLIKQPVFRNQLVMIVMINLFINFLPNVSWLGHLGGLVAGVMLGLVYSRIPQWKTLRESSQKALLLLVVMLVALAYVRPAKTEIYAGTDNAVLKVLEEKFNASWYTEPLREKLFKYYQSRGLFEWY